MSDHDRIELARLIETAMKRTFDHRVIQQAAGPAPAFAFSGRLGIFAEHFREPVLMGCVCGLGPKLRLAAEADCHELAGYELVALGVNNLCARGAQPLFFMSSLIASRLPPETRPALYDGIATACLLARCVYLGGGDEEQPEAFSPYEYGLSGFAVGMVERHRMIHPRMLRPGDVIIGLSSNGVHCSGFAAAHEAFLGKAGLGLDESLEKFGVQSTVRDELLSLTRIYTDAVRAVLSVYKVKRVVSALAHIAEGGLAGALGGLLRPGLDICVNRRSWEVPRIFPVLREISGSSDEEMYNVYNMGIGFILTIRPDFAAAALERIANVGYDAWRIGEVREGSQRLRFE